MNARETLRRMAMEHGDERDSEFYPNIPAMASEPDVLDVLGWMRGISTRVETFLFGQLDIQPSVVILRGVAGSGKSEIASSIVKACERFGIVVHVNSSDVFRTVKGEYCFTIESEPEVWELTKSDFRNAFYRLNEREVGLIVVDGTNLSESRFSYVTDLCKEGDVPFAVLTTDRSTLPITELARVGKYKVPLSTLALMQSEVSKPLNFR